MRKASTKKDRLGEKIPRRKKTPEGQTQYRKQKKISSETKENKIYKRTGCHLKKYSQKREKQLEIKNMIEIKYLMIREYILRKFSMK